jgi:(S)-ureidoglycine aminohydrolase
MDLFGSTRSRVCRDHALICPDSFVPSGLPTWQHSQAVVLIAPAMGARFTQCLAVMEAGAMGGPAPAGVERVIYVLDGEVTVRGPGRPTGTVLTPGGYAYFPPAAEQYAEGSIEAKTASRLNVFEKRYAPLPGIDPPPFRCGQEQDVAGESFLGDPDARLKTLLPTHSAFDLAVNVFTYQPGAALPQVEVHVMEHGLLMLDGQGVYRLGDHWYPVQKGDVIWMAPYCPQWFVAMGKTPARYLYYKDVNRHPLEAGT